MEAGDLLAKRQAQPGPALLAGAGFVYHIEGFRQTRQLLLRDAAPLVDHQKSVFIAVTAPVQQDHPSRLRRLHPIVDQIKQQRL